MQLLILVMIVIKENMKDLFINERFGLFFLNELILLINPQRQIQLVLMN